MQRSLGDFVIRNPVPVVILICLMLFIFWGEMMVSDPKEKHRTALGAAQAAWMDRELTQLREEKILGQGQNAEIVRCPDAAQTARLDRELTQLREDKARLQKLLQQSEVKAKGLESQLSQVNRSLTERAARQSEEIAALGMKVKERDLVNANLAAKQQKLEDAVKKQQQQLHGCEENVAATNEKLQRAEGWLRQCQWDRGRCQQQLSNHTSTMHRSSIFWTVLALLCLTLLYG